MAIVALSLDRLEIDHHEATFELKTLNKLNHTGDPLSTVQLAAFPEVRRICVVSAIRAYLSRTKQMRRSCQLLVSYIKPHKEISRDTLARWTISILKLAGVNTTKYASHSTCGVLVSKARQLEISVKCILTHAGWKTAHSFGNTTTRG